MGCLPLMTLRMASGQRVLNSLLDDALYRKLRKPGLRRSYNDLAAKRKLALLGSTHIEG